MAVRRWLPEIAIVVLALLLRAWAWSPFDIAHADEITQYLEQANRLATGHGIVPWESRVGLRNSLIPQLLCLPMWLGRTFAPGTMAAFYLARGTFLALSLIALPAAWRLGALVSRRHAIVALFVVAIWWESVLFSELLLSETLASALLLASAALVLDEKAERGKLVAGGLLLAFAVLVRLQYAPFAAVLFLATLWRTPARWLPLVAGGAIAALVGTASDLAAGATPFRWIVINFSQNIGAGKAAGFGTSPPWQYLTEYYLHFGAAALIFVLASTAAAGPRYRPLLLAAVVNVAVHSLIAHKEYRFIWVSTLVLLTVAAIGSLGLADRLFARHAVRWRMPLLALLGCWALLSLSSERTTGGYSSYRGGGALTRLAVRAAEDPRVCRLAIVKDYVYVTPGLLPRPLPLSIAPPQVEDGTRPLPPELARAANAILSVTRPAGTAAYRQVACENLPHERACLYVRPGRCAPDPLYDYQTALEHGGM